MAEIRPFRGIHYNKSLIKDWAAVICPPYDIISPQQQQELYLKSEFNFVRLEYTRELPQDTATDNKYTRAAATMEQWLKQGVLETDDTPAIYLHDQYFRYQRKEYKRRGIIARVKIEEWETKVVRPHEGTTSNPKSDRLSLLRALQANTSPILAIYDDHGQQITAILAAEARNKPLISLKSVDGEKHVIWAITRHEVVDHIISHLIEEPLYIADGHHRYESALTYQRERRASLPTASGQEGFNFVMMTLVDFADPGLIILPPHRLVRGISKPALSGLMSKLQLFFKVEELPLSKPGVWQQIDSLPTDTNETRLVLFGLAPDRLFLLKLSNPAAASQMMPHFHSELYKKLDVSIVDHIILEKLLGLSSEKEATSLAYSYDRQDAIKRVSAQEYQIALLLSPVKPTTIKAIADIGDKMPRKSTYFYPKLPSGLIVNRLV
ncbi:MAG: DUF1015 domain-containing protein [Chloroflexi bacterium]|nr:DUF1015 domain-containing protein [Chloroflexota bacterium]